MPSPLWLKIIVVVDEDWHLTRVSIYIMSLTGKLKKVIEEKGFGFIERDDGKGDLFVHVSKLPRSNKVDMVVGTKLSFDESWNNKTGKYCAENVTVVKDSGDYGCGDGGAYKSQSEDHGKITFNHKMYRKDGRTRTKKKEVLPDGHHLVKKRKQDTANGSKWERW